MNRIIAVFFVILAFVLLPANTEAQNIGSLQLQSVTVGSGEDAISSGISGVAVFGLEDGSVYGEFTVLSSQAWVILAKNFSVGDLAVTAGGSAGHFQGAPMGGPYVLVGYSLSENTRVTGLYWPALFPWEPADWKNDDKPNEETILMGNFGMTGLEFGNRYKLKLSFAGLNFLNDPTTWMPGGAITVPLDSKGSFTSSATWNTHAAKWMFYMGFTRTFG